MEKEEYIIKWQEAIAEAANALKCGDYETYKVAMEKAEQIAWENKANSEYVEGVMECKSFGTLNAIFESALPTLFKKNQKAVKKFMKTIKEDKNLLSQFMFFKSLDSYNKNINSKEYLQEALDLALKNIDIKSVAASNKKLGRIIVENRIKPTESVSDSKKSLYEDCNYLLTHKKGLLNLSKYNDSLNKVSKHLESNINESVEVKNITNTLENFNSKYSAILTNEEKDFMKQLVESKQSGNVEKQEKLFNAMKNECIEIISKLLETTTGDDKEGLIAIKEQLENQKFIEETLVKDIAKFVEIKDVLRA